MERIALTDQPAAARSEPGKMEPDGRAILLGLRARDRSALGELAEGFGAALARAAYLYLGDAGLAADAAQEAMIAAWDGAPRTGETTRLRPWIFGILFNRARKISRTESRRRSRERKSAAERPREAVAGDDGLDRDERLEALRRALARLEAASREVIILRYERGLGVAEAAEALGVPEGTVKSRTHAALARLRLEMERNP